MKRHRWVHYAHKPSRCSLCGVTRRAVRGPHGGTQTQYTWPDGRTRTVPEDAPRPQCERATA